MKQFFDRAKSFHEALLSAQSLIKPIDETERVWTIEALGRIVATEIVSPLDLPGFTRSGMDGYAVRSSDTQGSSEQNPRELRVIGRAEMGQSPTSLARLETEQAMELGTGGPLPPGADAVIILESTERIAPDRVRVFADVAVGAHTIGPDEDFKKGEHMYAPGHRIRPVDIGTILSCGIQRIRVIRPIRVGVISTGDELVAATERPEPGQIREINSHILNAQLCELGARAKLYGIVKDNREFLLRAVQQALSETDFVLISGGSSVGAKDLTEQVLAALGDIHIHGLHMKPGRPTIFALCQETPVVGLPGNPVSSAVVFAKFVAPLIAKKAGTHQMVSLRLPRAKLSHRLTSVKGRADFVPMALKHHRGQAFIEQVKGHTTNISTLAKADGLLYIEPEEASLAQGQEVWFEVW
jgi:molybdopterin molybdotransferase